MKKAADFSERAGGARGKIADRSYRIRRRRYIVVFGFVFGVLAFLSINAMNRFQPGPRVSPGWEVGWLAANLAFWCCAGFLLGKHHWQRLERRQSPLTKP